MGGQDAKQAAWPRIRGKFIGLAGELGLNPADTDEETLPSRKTDRWAENHAHEGTTEPRAGLVSKDTGAHDRLAKPKPSARDDARDSLDLDLRVRFTGHALRIGRWTEEKNAEREEGSEASFHASS